MIRLSEPGDTADIKRLALAQFKRTPWEMKGAFRPADAFHVCERGGHIAACVGYARDGQVIHAMHVWSEDGFSGKRAAVELMKDLKSLADVECAELHFTVTELNVGLQHAVTEHGCQPFLSGEPNTVTFRRKATSWAVQQ